MSSRKVRAGQAEIELNVKSRVAAGMRKAGEDIKKRGRGLAKIGAGVMAAGGAIAAPLAGAVKHFAAVGDQLHKMSIRTRASTEDLSELGFAAEQSGANLANVGSAMFRMNRRIGNATQGTGPAVRAFKAINLEADELSKMGGADQLQAIAEGLQTVESETLRLQYAFEILGDGLKPLWPLLAEGAGQMKELRQQARDLGLSVSQMDADNAAEFGDALNVVTRIGKAMAFEIGAAVAPAVTDLLHRFSAVANGARAWVAENRELFASIAAVAAGVIIFGAAITTAGFVMIGLGAALTAAASAFSFLLSPIGLVTIGIVAFGVAVFKYTEFAGKAVAWLADRFSPLMDAIGDTGEILFDALARGEWADAFKAATNLAELAWLDLTTEVRELWDAVADALTNTSTAIAVRIGAAFQAVGESIGDVFRWIANAWAETVMGMFSLLHKFGKALDEHFMVDSPMGKLGTLIRATGSLGQAGVAKWAENDFGGLGNQADAVGGKIAEFGRLMQQEAERRGRDKIEGRQDARNERQARRDELRQQIRQGAEGARERNRERKEQLAKLLKMPQLPELGQFDGSGGMGGMGGMGGKSGPGNRGAFSSAALAFLGTTAATPEKRTADGVARLVDIQQQMLDNQQQGVVPVFGD